MKDWRPPGDRTATHCQRERELKRERQERGRESRTCERMIDTMIYDQFWCDLMRGMMWKERGKESISNRQNSLSVAGGEVWERGRERDGRRAVWDIPNCPETVLRLSENCPELKKLSFNCLLTVAVCGIGSVGRESCRESCVTRSECWKWANLRPLIWSSFALWLWGR